MRSLVILIAAVSLGSVPVDAQDHAAREKALAVARKALEEGGVDSAVASLNSFPPRVALSAYHQLVFDLYRKDRRVDRMVQIARAAIRFGFGHAKRAGKKDSALADELLGSTKAIAYNLASFTWPGWGEEGITITPDDREVGLRAARINLQLARDLGRGARALSAAHWVLAAHLLAAGQFDAAAAGFESARRAGRAAEDPLSVLMVEGYIGITLILAGSREAEGRRRLDAAVAALEEEGSGDARFYARQLRRALRALSERGQVRRSTAPVPIHCGRLDIVVAVSRTAVLFHVVDAVARGAKGRLTDALSLSDEDRQALEVWRSVRLRKADALARALCSSDDLDEALFLGAADGSLSSDDVERVRGVLTRFRGRVGSLFDADRERLAGVVSMIPRERLTEAASDLAELTGSKKVALRIFPVPSSDSTWRLGVFGDRALIEVPAEGSRDLTTLFLHAAARAFLARRVEAMLRMTERVPGLDLETLSEGIAVAVSGHPPISRFGKSLIPVLEKRPEGEEFSAFLERCRAAWLLPGRNKSRKK